MDYPSQAYHFHWQGIEIAVTYKSKWNANTHLEVRSLAPDRAPLTISSEGWRSYFHPMGTIDAHGGDVIAQVTAWLDGEATKPEWQAHIARNKQGELF